MKKADVDKMCSYLRDALWRLGSGNYGNLARARLDVGVVLEKLEGTPEPVIDHLQELEPLSNTLTRSPAKLTELKFMNECTEMVSMKVRNVRDRNPKAEIQIEAEIDKGPGRSRKFISLSIPSSHYIDFVMGILRSY